MSSEKIGLKILFCLLGGLAFIVAIELTDQLIIFSERWQARRRIRAWVKKALQPRPEEADQ